jgi:hypothetical protein
MRRITTQNRYIDYVEFLRGTLKVEGLTYDGNLCRAWMALEEHWTEVVKKFHSFDADFDCKVSFFNRICLHVSSVFVTFTPSTSSIRLFGCCFLISNIRIFFYPFKSLDFFFDSDHSISFALLT